MSCGLSTMIWVNNRIDGKEQDMATAQHARSNSAGMTHMTARNGKATILGMMAAIVMLSGLLGGCVGQGNYDNLYTMNRRLQERNSELERERDESRASLSMLQSRSGSGEGALSELQRRLLEAERQRDQAMRDFADLQNKLAGLQFGPVDADTDELLRRLANEYPDLIKYDSARGMLRFASDLTFDSGSAVVRNDAKPAIQALARILNTASASTYEVVFEGHTDSQRISKESTRRLHPTNRYLSVHRSIAVIDELIGQNVNPGRMMAAGWGEFRPTVANNPGGNTAQNRRVEIFLAKSSHSADAAEYVAPTDGASGNLNNTMRSPDRQSPPPRPVDVTK